MHLSLCLPDSVLGLSLIISQHVATQEALKTQFTCEIISMPKLQRAEITEMSMYLHLHNLFSCTVRFLLNPSSKRS